VARREFFLLFSAWIKSSLDYQLIATHPATTMAMASRGLPPSGWRAGHAKHDRHVPLLLLPSADDICAHSTKEKISLNL